VVVVDIPVQCGGGGCPCAVWWWWMSLCSVVVVDIPVQCGGGEDNIFEEESSKNFTTFLHFLF